MELKLYDTLSKEKRVFVPLNPANVRMYVCGPTVYDFAHIGNARPVIVFDVLYRLLRHCYGDDRVTYVRNITDVDDKINDRAARDFPGLPLNDAIRKVTEQTERQFHEDVDALGCLRPNVEPRATEHIAEMRTIIEKLIANGNAYVAQDHVLFAVATMPKYGQLARRSLDEMMAGARVDVAPYKRDAMDFVLWKPAKPGEPSWPSPGGIKVEGRPGWHIECSAMAWKHLGEQFDIHGGGIDLVFPHHENELAQSCCAFHEERMANVWMHNGFLQVEGEKMSKSLGNFITIRQLRDSWRGYRWPGDALRFNMIKTHYRQPIDWTYEGLDEAHKILWEWYELCKDVPADAIIPNSVVGALADDLNTPAVITNLHALRRQKNIRQLRSSLSFLGFTCDQDKLVRLPPLISDGFSNAADAVIGNAHRHRQNVVQSQQGVVNVHSMSVRIEAHPPDIHALTDDEINALIETRLEARRAKNFAESDRIRDLLLAVGVILKDGKDPETGELTTTRERAR